MVAHKLGDAAGKTREEIKCDEMDEVRKFGVGVPFGQWGLVQCLADASGGGRFFRFGFWRVGLPPLITL